MSRAQIQKLNPSPTHSNINITNPNPKCIFYPSLSTISSSSSSLSRSPEITIRIAFFFFAILSDFFFWYFSTLRYEFAILCDSIRFYKNDWDLKAQAAHQPARLHMRPWDDFKWIKLTRHLPINTHAAGNDFYGSTFTVVCVSISRSNGSSTLMFDLYIFFNIYFYVISNTCVGCKWVRNAKICSQCPSPRLKWTKKEIVQKLHTPIYLRDFFFQAKYCIWKYLFFMLSILYLYDKSIIIIIIIFCCDLFRWLQNYLIIFFLVNIYYN